MTNNVAIILVIIALFLIVSLVSTIVLNIIGARKHKARIKRDWGTLQHLQRKNPDSEKSIFSSFLIRKKYEKYDFCVDDMTWENLNLQKIYAQINNTQTSIGAEALYTKLRLLHNSPDKDFEQLKAYLADNPSEREQLQHALAKLGKKSDNQAFQIVYDSGLKGVKYDKLYVVLGLMPILSLLLVPVSLILGIVACLAFISFNIIFYTVKKYALEFELERLSYLIQIIRTSKALGKIDFPYSSRVKEISSHFKFLINIGYTVNQTNDYSDTSVISEYINAIFMTPFIAYSRLNKKLKNNNARIQELMKIISDVDVATAIDSYLEYVDYYCLPSLHEQSELQAQDMYHPLLKNPVSNSISYAQNVVISGDNASGKTTFMRTVAVNCILSQSLNFALAREFSLRPGGILSSMNISDDLTSGESHFVAEGKRIKTIIQALSDNSDFYYLFLDEIFNGTNSAERVSIGASLMEWLADKNCLYIISTHDFELIKAVKRFNQNYHFTTDSSGESDYILKQGISRTTNAIATLRKLDFPEVILHSSVEKLNKILENNN
ncbi:MAG: hypothetical protein LBV19_02770 [Streptococcaceae bacterium]|jgi:energy-coupling factor transporter ATP-binding protein EcfA2|nr:hypothetical protein [Streptococcaceae bacterium]